jgi:starch synthase
MNVLFVSSEVAPFSKSGGLADVAGALPSALARLGHQVLVVTPLYRTVRDKRVRALGRPLTLEFPFGTERVWLHEAQVADGHRVLLLGHGSYDRDGLYGDGRGEFGDNARRFALLSVGALSAAQAVGFAPDVVHLNDWQAGLGALALRAGYEGTALGRAKSVLTLHNLAYQGNFPREVMGELGLPRELFTSEGLEFHGQLSFLKAGILYADVVTAVSPRYARDIQTPEGGNGLDGLLRAKRHALTGILNGIDVAEWNPETDVHLPARYSAQALSGKAACKAEALAAFGLRPGADVPLFVFVSRLADQKGFDLLIPALEGLLRHHDVRVLGLGTGEKWMEEALAGLAARSDGKMGMYVGYQEKLAHVLEAAGDFFLMPSRFEPCGLNQMYSQRYGTIPVVRATGGLADTVVDVGTGQGTGITFEAWEGGALWHALERAVGLYRDGAALGDVRLRGMAQDFSWERSARAYEAVYRGG